MAVKRKRIILVAVLLALALGAAGSIPTIPTISSHDVGIAGIGATTVVYADGCEGPSPPPGLDCLGNPTPTPTPPGQ